MCFRNENGNNNSCCCAITIISALIAAIGIAAIFFAGVVTSITTLIVITLVLGILGLLYVIITNVCGNRNCKIIDRLCLVPTIVGSIVVPIFALVTAELPAGSITSALFIGAVAFFLILSLINLLRIILFSLCSNRCNDYLDK